MQFKPFIFAGAVALFASGCKRGEAASNDAESNVKVDSQSVTIPANDPQLKSLTIAQVSSAAPDSSRIPGRVVWNEDATVRVFSPFAGRVVKVFSDVGRTVRAGDTLALITAPDFGQAQADASRAAADLAQAERNATRQHDLFDHGVVARKDVESADGDLARAKAEAARADARVKQYGGSASSVDQVFALRAPVGGTIVDRAISTGQEVRPDQMLANAPQLFAPLFTITDPARLWVLLDLPERDVTTMRPGTSVALRPEALANRVYDGTITLVSNAVDPNTRTVKARANVANGDGLLKSEMMVAVTLQRDRTTSLAVPVNAVLLEGERHVVFVADGPNKFRRQVVDTGPEHSGMVAIRSGLSPNDKIVADGALFIEQFFHQ